MVNAKKKGMGCLLKEPAKLVGEFRKRFPCCKSSNPSIHPQGLLLNWAGNSCLIMTLKNLEFVTWGIRFLCNLGEGYRTSINLSSHHQNGKYNNL